MESADARRCAFVASLVCCFEPLFEFAARFSGNQVLISPDGDPVPYEYLSESHPWKMVAARKTIRLGYSLAVVFWFVTLVVVYGELSRFLWRRLWSVRFALCFVASSRPCHAVFITQLWKSILGQLTRFSFVVQPELADQNDFYVLHVVAAAAHVFLVFFALTQLPKEQHLVSLPFDGYEVSFLNAQK